ncbi:helix-turn-helix domain-containing protein [Phytoactinopolyspora limicola]|uniref:helix-turn-helix domain-containing protein n=1 Tax=Phytoactinopolyspora limicola TaxID=2715536 RepID=UPI00140C45F6|nr:helix-turn-helix domain-containing protein [Phytoactinopolyspora limicola]
MASVSIFDITEDMLPPPPTPAPRTPGTNGGFGYGRPRFTQEDIRAILAAYNAGQTLVSIARRYGCSTGAIRYQLKRHGAEGHRAIDQHGRATGADDLVRRCSRCGIVTTEPEMCRDCVDVLALDGGDTDA